MKFKIVMKAPDSIHASVEQAIRDSLPDDYNAIEDADGLLDERRAEFNERIKKWVEYGEYVTIEIDTDADTARVCEVS
jgi:hypothetical protein